MEFVFVNALNIPVELEILNRGNTQPDRILLYEHKGEFVINNERAGNLDSASRVDGSSSSKKGRGKLTTRFAGEELTLSIFIA